MPSPSGRHIPDTKVTTLTHSSHDNSNLTQLLEQGPGAQPDSAPTSYVDLRSKISSHTAKVGIVGLGYVGLPLAMAFAESGFDVLGFDVNPRTVETLNRGESHIPDVDAQQVRGFVQDQRFGATTDMSRLADADIVSICVPTPLSKTRDPDISYVSAATDQVASSLRSGQLVILESTTYPGTTREVILPRLEATGLRVGVDFFLAFSPERVDPGNAKYGIKNTPKVVGGLDPQSTELARLFYAQAIDTVVPVSGPEVAEMAKLLENTFRAVNIGLANETALMCDRLGIDVWEVIDAAATKPFGFMPFYPGPGIGGHCIPLDPHYLSWKMRTLNYRARFIELASEINSSMPYHVVGKVAAGLNADRKSVNGSRVLVIGVAYKPDIDDVRESPALDVIELLRQDGAEVAYHDPHVRSIRLPDVVMQSVELTEKAMAEVDCVVIATDHAALDKTFILAHAQLVVDSRNAFGGEDAGKARVLSI